MKIYFPKMISFLFVGALLFSSCGGGDDKKDETPEDTSPPTISTSIPNSTENTFGDGQYIHYEGTFTDDIALAKVVFTLTDNKGVVVSENVSVKGVEHEPWTPADFSFDLSGKTYSYKNSVFDSSFDSNEYWTGSYTLTVVVEDESGKSTSQEISINLE